MPNNIVSGSTCHSSTMNSTVGDIDLILSNRYLLSFSLLVLLLTNNLVLRELYKNMMVVASVCLRHYCYCPLPTISTTTVLKRPLQQLLLRTTHHLLYKSLPSNSYEYFNNYHSEGAAPNLRQKKSLVVAGALPPSLFA